MKAGWRNFSSSRCPGPLPLARSRFASPHAHRPPACGRRRFPSLGFELPALTNRCLPAPSALGPGRRLRRAGAPGPLLRDVRERRQALPPSSRFILQPRGSRRTQSTIKAPLSRSCPCFPSPEAPGEGEVFPPLPQPTPLPTAEGNGGRRRRGAGAKGRLRGAGGIHS